MLQHLYQKSANNDFSKDSETLSRTLQCWIFLYPKTNRLTSEIAFEKMKLLGHVFLAKVMPPKEETPSKKELLETDSSNGDCAEK